MKQILAFGDSLTWGANPGGGRHPFEDRWPSVLEATLDGVRVITEGLPGRTTAFEDAASDIDRNGARVLPMLLASHVPMDLVIIMLGTNDLKPHVCGKAAGSAEGIAQLVEIITAFDYGKGNAAPKILVVSPPRFCQPAPPRTVLFDGMKIDESYRLAPALKTAAERLGCLFLDVATVAEASPIDGVHLDAENTRAIGAAIARFLTEADLP